MCSRPFPVEDDEGSGIGHVTERVEGISRGIHDVSLVVFDVPLEGVGHVHKERAVLLGRTDRLHLLHVLRGEVPGLFHKGVSVHRLGEIDRLRLLLQLLEGVLLDDVVDRAEGAEVPGHGRGRHEQAEKCRGEDAAHGRLLRRHFHRPDRKKAGPRAPWSTEHTGQRFS